MRGRLVRVMVAHGAPHVSMVQGGTKGLGSRVACVDDTGDVAHLDDPALSPLLDCKVLDINATGAGSGLPLVDHGDVDGDPFGPDKWTSRHVQVRKRHIADVDFIELAGLQAVKQMSVWRLLVIREIIHGFVEDNVEAFPNLLSLGVPEKDVLHGASITKIDALAAVGDRLGLTATGRTIRHSPNATTEGT